MSRRGRGWALFALPWLGWAVLAETEHTPGGRRPARNVFWPVNYAPVSAVSPTVGDGDARSTPPATTAPRETPPPVEDWSGAQKAVRISGISRTPDGRAIVLIAGALYHEGEVLDVTHKGRVYQFRIRKIDEDGLELRRIEPEKNDGTDAVPPAGKP